MEALASVLGNAVESKQQNTRRATQPSDKRTSGRLDRWYLRCGPLALANSRSYLQSLSLRTVEQKNDVGLGS